MGMYQHIVLNIKMPWLKGRALRGLVAMRLDLMAKLTFACEENNLRFQHLQANAALCVQTP